MNCLRGYIEDFSGQGNLTLLHVRVNSVFFTVMVIENAQNVDSLKKGAEVELLFNESEVILGKNISGLLSIVNSFKSRVLSIEYGVVFSRLKLDLFGEKIYSLITTEAFDNMGIKENDLLNIYINTNEIFVQYPEIEEND